MSKMMLWQLLLNAVEEKKRGIRAIDGFRNKLMIPDFEIPKCPEFEVKSKIENIFKSHNFLKIFCSGLQNWSLFL